MSELLATTDCIATPNGNLALNIVRVIDCTLKALVIPLLWINLPHGKWALRKSIPMHANLKVLNCELNFLVESFADIVVKHVSDIPSACDIVSVLARSPSSNCNLTSQLLSTFSSSTYSLWTDASNHGCFGSVFCCAELDSPQF